MAVTLSVLMLASIALLIGAGYLWFGRGLRKQAALMGVLALVMLANVAIWTVPDAGGEAPLDQIAE